MNEIGVRFARANKLINLVETGEVVPRLVPGERVRQEVGVPGREFGRPVVDDAECARLACRDGDHRRRRQPEREGSASRAIARGPRPYQAEDLSRIYGRRVVRVSWRPIIRIAGR